MTLRNMLQGMQKAAFQVGVDSGQAGFIPAVPELSSD